MKFFMSNCVVLSVGNFCMVGKEVAAYLRKENEGIYVMECL